MPLHPQLLDLVLRKLSLVYGARFMAQYSGIDIGLVKADWAHELSSTTPAGIRYALQNLPRDFPPNVLQFRDICARRPLPGLQTLPRPETPPEQVKALTAQLATKKPKGRDPLAWAHALRQRELRCERISNFQRFAWREALGENNDDKATT